MKSKLILLLAVAAVLFGGVCVFLARRSARQQDQVQALRRELELKEQQVHDLELAKDRLNQQGRELLQQAQERALEASRQPPAAALPGRAPQSAVPGQNAGDQPASEKGGLGSMLAQLMRDPETRKLIQQQQRLIMDQLYGPLIKQMGLPPEEADKLKELLAENAGKATERASSLLGGLSSSNRTEMLGALAAQNKAHEDQLKELLGQPASL
jgi:HAMP domain-containing protein